MLLSVFPIILIVIGLTMVITIVVRKIPQLRVLDVDALPEEKDRQKKEKILEERFTRALSPWQQRLRAFGSRIASWLSRGQGKFRGYVNRVADKYRDEHGKIVKKKFFAKPSRVRARELTEMLDEADALRHDDDLMHAEEKYIAAIALDPKSVRAYKGLGKMYFAQEKYVEAKETFMFLSSIAKDDDIVFAFLGRIAKAQHQWGDAVKWYQKALRLNKDVSKRWIDLAVVYLAMGEKETEAKNAYMKAYELEPRNPSVLDQVVQFAINSGDKALAREMLTQLQEVNPENQKLPELKELVHAMR